MKLISVKIHTDIAMVVPDDYDTNDPNLIEAISEAVKQDLVNIFDDTMVTIKEIETIEDIPLGYLPGNTEPWLAPDLNDVEIARYGQLTCKELLTLPIHNGKHS